MLDSGGMLFGDETPDTLASLHRKVRKPGQRASVRPTQSDLFSAFKQAEEPTEEHVENQTEERAKEQAENPKPAESKPGAPTLVETPSISHATREPERASLAREAVAPAVATVAPVAADPNARRIWSVRALVSNIRESVERGYTDLWVEGEISNCRPAPSGHIYFTLKDGDAQLPIVLFRRQAQLLRFRPTDGLAVLVRGRISVYESRGQLQLIAETMEPRGSGALQLAFEQLKQRLAAEGLFDPARKRPLPGFPRCIGVVTSPTGAVIRDIATVVRRRHAHLDLLIYPAAMQGVNCPSSVAAGIRWFNANPGRVDLIVLARGGGSIEDLSGFNDEALARAIAASELPVVSAIGHETDFTIADFVADLRAPTPSAAAELVTSAQHRIEERVRRTGDAGATGRPLSTAAPAPALHAALGGAGATPAARCGQPAAAAHRRPAVSNGVRDAPPAAASCAPSRGT